MHFLPTCNQTCKDFEKERCVRLDRAPYVCNGCTKKISHCTIVHKYSYNARFADKKYREKLRDSRTRINMTKQELHKKDQIISPLIEQGQSPYHILTNHPELDMSIRTMYSYLDQGLFTARKPILKQKIHFKPRKCHKTQITDRAVFTTRLYRDFFSLGLMSYVQMDTFDEPMQSGQKGRLEQAHTILRMVLPKGTSFEFLTQWDVNLIVNHINFTPGESLGGRTPYCVASETFREKVLNAFQLRPIAPDEVNLTPKLILFNH